MDYHLFCRVFCCVSSDASSAPYLFLLSVFHNSNTQTTAMCKHVVDISIGRSCTSIFYTHLPHTPLSSSSVFRPKGYSLTHSSFSLQLHASLGVTWLKGRARGRVRGCTQCLIFLRRKRGNSVLQSDTPYSSLISESDETSVHSMSDDSICRSR